MSALTPAPRRLRAQLRDAQSFELATASQGEFAAEFQFRGNRTWWDSLVDGLNRLPRPLMALGTVGLFVWCAVDPQAFSIAMTAMALVPEPLWWILGAVVGFFFGGRMQVDWSKIKAPSAAQVKQVVQAQEQIRQSYAEAPDADGSGARVAPGALQSVTVQTGRPAQSDAAYRADMADESSALSNATILEWNRRQRQGTAAQGATAS